MLKWTIYDAEMYKKYLEWRDELNNINQCRFNIDMNRKNELELNIKKYLNTCGESTLKNILLWSMDINE